MMTTTLLLLICALAFFQLLTFGAVVELHRQVLQLRQFSGLVDEARVLPINTDVDLLQLPIPAITDLPLRGRGAILVLSDSCTTCQEIAKALPDELPEHLLVLLQGRSPEAALRWALNNGVVFGPSVVYDQDRKISDQLDVSVTPAVVRIEDQYAVGAATVSSSRQLDKVLEWLEELRAQAMSKQNSPGG